ncbi:LOW QUALITY PROTEIN: hypothetical protein TorRG33x02_071790 [Trema orientale]|uniref:Uncharacterized protein n=1 Tax=Trema orientale TaxID=63057 RepID=A0A2P5FH71_TREOI|nr:LOW QUALITY PROTEIN: hypothetical protein TorRG33x02_071790 [Trema orientale]
MCWLQSCLSVQNSIHKKQSQMCTWKIPPLLHESPKLSFSNYTSIHKKQHKHYQIHIYSPSSLTRKHHAKTNRVQEHINEETQIRERKRPLYANWITCIVNISDHRGIFNQIDQLDPKLASKF